MSKINDFMQALVDKVNRAVRIDPQALTEAQKKQVRDNIDAASVDDVGTTDYNELENRPVYSNGMKTVVILPETKVETELNEDDGSYYAIIPYGFELEVGKTYTVTRNGVDYVCAAQWDENHSRAYILHRYQDGDGGYGGFGIMPTPTATLVIGDSGTYSITTEVEDVKTLDPKFLPDMTLRLTIVDDTTATADRTKAEVIDALRLGIPVIARLDDTGGMVYAPIVAALNGYDLAFVIDAGTNQMLFEWTDEGLSYTISEAESAFSPVATVTETADGAVITIEDAEGTTTATIKHGKDGADGKDGKDGQDGRDGVDGYTPVKGVDYFDGRDGIDGKDGTNGIDGKDGYTPVKGVDYFDGKNGVDGKDGYTPVKGIDYFDGKDGKDGVDGKDGYTPKKGIDYFDGNDGVAGKDGVDGKDGIDGVSSTHSWNGTTLTITSASGTSSANLKGDKGDKGDTGATGKNGSDASVTADNIKSALGYTPADAADLTELSNEKVVVRNAVASTFPTSQKPAAADLDGYDIDVLNATADDIHAYIDEVVSDKPTVTKEILGKDASGKYDMARYIYAKREHLAWVKENYPKMYGWRNGDAVMYTESVSPRVGEKAYNVPYIGGKGTGTETVTVPAVVGFVYNKRYSQSGGAFSSSTTESSVIIPVEISEAITSSNPVTLKINGGAQINSGRSIYYGSTNSAFPKTATATVAASNNGEATITGMEAGKWFIDVTVTTNTTGVSDATTVPNMSVVFGDKTITTVAVGNTSAAHETSTTTEVETEGGTPITEVKVATVASGATTNTIPSSRIIGGLEYVRSAADDVEPTVIYTDVDDERNADASITQDGITYNRYPMGDLGANREKLNTIFIYANEHGINRNRLDETDAKYQKYETKMCALVAARFIRDLADGKQSKNPLYNYIRENCRVIIIPVANPHGYNCNVTGVVNSIDDGYYNGNSVNTNRNFDTPGWIVSENRGEGQHGAYPGSENETQYLMNTMVESGAVVAMSLHGIGGHFTADGNDGAYGLCAHQGQNPDGSHYDKATMDKISDFLFENYGYKMMYYDRRETDHIVDFEVPNGESINLPDRACKSPSYITYCGAYGGIIEFQPDDIKTSGYQQAYKGYIIENAYAQMLNLTAMWLADYLEQ